MKKLLWIIIMLCLCSCSKPEETVPENPEIEETSVLSIEKRDRLPDAAWQKEVSFPDAIGDPDDTLAMNSMCSFYGYTGQGEMFVRINKDLDSFDLYINSIRADLEETHAGDIYRIDFAKTALNGRNSVQVSGIDPADIDDALTVYIPYPVVISGDLKDEGFHDECFDLISDLIESDINYGFPGAQLAIIRNGKLVYTKTWGYLNSYDQYGTILKDRKEADDQTMYDLASVTKMFAGNYAIQKLVSEGKISVDDKAADYLGDSFYEDTLDFVYTFGADPGLETMKEWKASITIRDLLRHAAGFPPAPRYFNINIDAASQDYDEQYYNLLYAGSDHNEKTREATEKAICQTPLLYEPGTDSQYSDVDYMILALIAEKVSGMSLDEYLKKNFFEPLELKRITFNPLENGYQKDDCAATELNGNTRDGVVNFPGVRTETIQGEVHDEMAWHSMNGVSGHAGLFASAEDLARLASVMFTGGYGYDRFFSRNVIDLFTSPNSPEYPNSGLGWARQGDDRRSWYYGTQSTSDVFGHQGWTGTLAMIDPDRDIVMVYLTNLRNTPLTDKEENANDFRGLWYTAGTLGFVPQLFSIGLDEEGDMKTQLLSLLESMVYDSMKLIPSGVSADHPSYDNVLSKIDVYKKWVDTYGTDTDKEKYEKLLDHWNSLKEN